MRMHRSCLVVAALLFQLGLPVRVHADRGTYQAVAQANVKVVVDSSQAPDLAQWANSQWTNVSPSTIVRPVTFWKQKGEQWFLTGLGSAMPPWST